MKIQNLEPTPNPNAFKFNLAEKLSQRPRSFPNADAAQSDPLGARLFEIDGIDSVFYYENFVTISKLEDADWEEVMTAAGQCLIDFDATDLPQEAEGEEGDGGLNLDDLDEETAELIKRINAVVDEMVRPALAGDGGGLDILGVDNQTVFIRYQGACGTCPSAISGTLMAIERLIKHQVDPNLTVVPA